MIPARERLEVAVYDYSFRLEDIATLTIPSERDPTMGLYYEELTEHGRFDSQGGELSQADWEDAIAQ